MGARLGSPDRGPWEQTRLYLAAKPPNVVSAPLMFVSCCLPVLHHVCPRCRVEHPASRGSSPTASLPLHYPMSPLSSYSLPSPTFPPCPFAPIDRHPAYLHASTPTRPHRLPARVAGLISPLTNLTSSPAPSLQCAARFSTRSPT